MLNRVKLEKPNDDVINLIVRSGDLDQSVASEARYELAKSMEMPLRQGILVGDVIGDIFETITMAPGSSMEFPLDLLAPGEEDQHVAYTNPGNGRIPERQVESDYVMIPTYGITSSIDWLLRYARDARWDIVGRAMQVLEASFVKKLNDDGFHTLLSAAADRNILVFDADATAGQFTKRLVSLMKTVMVRQGGGNTASLKRSRLTDIYMSPEGIEDIRNWGVDQVDELTRREIYTAADGTIKRIFGVNLRDLVELGEGQEYQQFFTSSLGGSLATGDLELVVGLDLQTRGSFVMPVKMDLEIFNDPYLHRQQRDGYYGLREQGFGVLDNRDCILGSY